MIEDSLRFYLLANQMYREMRQKMPQLSNFQKNLEGICCSAENSGLYFFGFVLTEITIRAKQIVSVEFSGVGREDVAKCICGCRGSCNCVFSGV